MVEATEQVPEYEYAIPFSYKKIFSPEECNEFIRAFKGFDKDGNGSMNAAEFKQAVIDLGHRDITDERINELLTVVDKNHDAKIDFHEFLEMWSGLRSDRANFGDAKDTKQGAAAQVDGAVGSHTYLLEERSSFSRAINHTLKDDELLKDRLPMNPDSDDLFHVMSDGLVLIKLGNYLSPDLVDMRTVNLGNNLSIFKVRENLNLALTAAKGHIKLIGIDAQTFLDKSPHLVLGVLWQIVHKLQTKSVSLKDTPEIMRLAQGDEELADLVKLSADAILVRWVNFHLKAAEQPEIKALGKELADGKVLTYVLNQLDAEKASLEGLADAEDLTRQEKVVLNSQAIGVPDIASAQDLTKGNPKVNALFVSEIFNTKHGLDELNKEELEAYEAAALVDDDTTEGSREERSFRLWINSLGLEGVFIDNLFEECRTGMLLLKVIDKIDNTVVEWDRVEKNANNTFK